MKKNVFAICDLEESYVSLLSDYVIQRGNIPFEVHAFTSLESLQDFLGSTHVELLLISSRAYTPHLASMDVEKIVLLSEVERKEQEGELASVYKYQSCRGILKETMEAYGQARAVPLPLALAKKVSRTYGVFAPFGGAGCTSLALTLGMELSRRAPTLLLNLEGNSGLEKALGLLEGKSLSELLYYARQRDASISAHAMAAAQAVEELSLIPPVALSQDIHQAEAGDIQYLLTHLRMHTSFEAFVIDVGREIGEIPEVLDLCDVILMPRPASFLAQAKEERWREEMRLEGWGEILDKLDIFTLPAGLSLMPGQDFASHLIWGELGERVRSYLVGGEGA